MKEKEEVVENEGGLFYVREWHCWRVGEAVGAELFRRPSEIPLPSFNEDNVGH